MQIPNRIINKKKNHHKAIQLKFIFTSDLKKKNSKLADKSLSFAKFIFAMGRFTKGHEIAIKMIFCCLKDPYAEREGERDRELYQNIF